MERTVKITLEKAREWYNQGGDLKEIALQAFNEKELKGRPISWEDYVRSKPDGNFAYIDGASVPTLVPLKYPDLDANVWLSTSHAEAVIALNKLLHLRKAWKDNGVRDGGACIFLRQSDEFGVSGSQYVKELFRFERIEDAEAFLETFKDLFEEVKVLWN